MKHCIIWQLTWLSLSFFLSALVLEEIAIDRDLEKEKLDEAQSLHLASLLLARYTGLKIYYTTLNQEKKMLSHILTSPACPGRVKIITTKPLVHINAG